MAAEIGSMKVYQEIDALRTMNIDPVAYLVLPRLTAISVRFAFVGGFFDFGRLAGRRFCGGFQPGYRRADGRLLFQPQASGGFGGRF